MARYHPQTLYDRLWRSHIVAEQAGHPALLYVDLHLVHEGTYLQAFEMLDAQGIAVRQPKLTFATTDHWVPTERRLRRDAPLSSMSYVVQGLLEVAKEHGIEAFGPNDVNQGIVHVIGPELGLTLPGMTVVCGDSHTSTHGALGALSFGIGTTQVGHVLATQCLLQRKQKTLRVHISGWLRQGVTAKDLALHILSRHGVAFGREHVLEYAGTCVEAMSMAERMTLCNMSIEMGSRTGLVAPDDTTFEFVSGTPYAPTGRQWDESVERWRTLRSDDDALFDSEVSVDATDVEPMVTFGTTPGMGVPVSGRVPPVDVIGGPEKRRSYERALKYMGFVPGDRLDETRVSTVFIGSCSNSRVEDLRAAASVLRGRKVAAGTRLKIVPGSQAVKRQAEAEGLDHIFLAAGASWDEPGCSMCLAANGDVAPPQQYVASTSNRNFEGRQGPGARTLLMSPLTAAATAVAGVVADPRRYLDA